MINVRQLIAVKGSECKQKTGGDGITSIITIIGQPEMHKHLLCCALQLMVLLAMTMTMFDWTPLLTTQTDGRRWYLVWQSQMQQQQRPSAANGCLQVHWRSNRGGRGGNVRTNTIYEARKRWHTNFWTLCSSNVPATIHPPTRYELLHVLLFHEHGQGEQYSS